MYLYVREVTNNIIKLNMFVYVTYFVAQGNHLSTFIPEGGASSSNILFK